MDVVASGCSLESFPGADQYHLGMVINRVASGSGGSRVVWGWGDIYRLHTKITTDFVRHQRGHRQCALLMWLVERTVGGQ